jgi:hypothetical protein
MDPLPFLFLAVLIFGSLQVGAYLAWRSIRPEQKIVGTGQVKMRDFEAEPIPKLNRKKIT